MKVEDFNYTLPDELIAQYPLPNRSDSRMLVVDRDRDDLVDSSVKKLTDYLLPGDLLVFNNTRVIPARLWAKKASGGQVEIMIERVEDETHLIAQLRVNRKPVVGTRLLIEQQPEEIEIDVLEREGEFWRLRLVKGAWSQVLIDHGHMPLPPYIERADEASDQERYQTVYSAVPGAVAAPTAGLHFDEDLLAKIKNHGVEMGFCTLHVGAGTFQPIRADQVEDHIMHKEWMQVDQGLVDQVKQTKARGGRVIAVGTTAVRSLETAAQGGEIEPYQGDSQLFIYPGFTFNVIDGLLTNFHLPGSTLVMLVSAFSGREKILAAYQHAIDERYRFFSYGDATLLL
ncbi:MAG TPA: tRNA preQ1(34) S-adenosylmethionine ribosyltransferase-isomerase QueA [Wenzhouxiangella sp.]